MIKAKTSGILQATFVLALTAVAAAILPWTSRAQTGPAVPEMASLDAAIEAFMNKWDVPGGAFAVTYQGRLVYARGFGFADVANQIPVEPTSTFRIASVSKSVTGIALAKLIAEGALSKSDKVFGPGGILTGARYDTLADARILDITVGDLLHHTSGFGVLSTGQDPVFADHYVEGQMGFGLPHSPEDKIEYYIKTQTLRRNPGTGYEYSNLGYLTLGRVIEAVTGQSYTDYCQTALFDPLGISTFLMGSSLLDNRLPREVLYYEPAGSGTTTSVYGTGEQVPWSYGGMNVETFDAHGGWTASAIDLVRLLGAADGFATAPDILTPAAIGLLKTPTPASAGYAFGFAVNGADNWWHTGSIPGASAEWVRASGGFNFALLFNTRPTSQLGQFNTEMDGLFWNARNSFSGWPTHDLYSQFTGVDDLPHEADDLSISVYPNPTNEGTTVSISTADSRNFSVAVFDVLGRRVTRVPLESTGLDGGVFVDTNTLPVGVYFVRAEAGGRVATAQFVKRR